MGSAAADPSLYPGGKVQAEVKGQAEVKVTVAVEGGGRVTGLSATSSGNIKASAGTSMPHIAYPTGR
jgi:hypothetical protein